VNLILAVLMQNNWFVCTLILILWFNYSKSDKICKIFKARIQTSTTLHLVLNLLFNRQLFFFNVWEFPLHKVYRTYALKSRAFLNILQIVFKWRASKFAMLLIDSLYLLVCAILCEFLITLPETFQNKSSFISSGDKTH
jgi:hypothetical protein